MDIHVIVRELFFDDLLRQYNSPNKLQLWWVRPQSLISRKYFSFFILIALFSAALNQMGRKIANGFLHLVTICILCHWRCFFEYLLRSIIHSKFSTPFLYCFSIRKQIFQFLSPLKGFSPYAITASTV